MNIIELIYRLIGDFARLNPATVADLKSEAMQDYATFKKEDAPTWKQKAFKWLEHYGSRTLFALLFIWISRELRKTNSSTDEYEEED